jgi:hypothetical protein
VEAFTEIVTKHFEGEMDKAREDSWCIFSKPKWKL